VFGAGFGKDTVMDFAAGDVPAFEAGVFDDLEQVLAASQQIGADVVTGLDADNSVTLKQVTLSSLHADDFAFLA
jgi:hypothetical protein